MSRQTKIIIIVGAVVLILAGVFAYFYYATSPGSKSSFPSSGNGSQAGNNVVPTQPSVTDNGNAGSKTNGWFGESGSTQGLALRKITDKPVSGAVIIDSASSTRIRYIDRETGNVFETVPSDSASNRITNTTIPKIYEASFAKNGDSFVGRYLKDDEETIQSFLGKIKSSSSGVGEVESDFMPSNIRQVAISPSGAKAFYINNKGAGSIGILANIDGSSKIQIFSSDLKEWIASWPKEDTVVLTTKASAISGGLSYFLNTKTSKLTKILGGINGLTTLFNSNLSYGIYSESIKNGFNLNIFNAKNNSVINTSIKTLPEKCAWSKKNPAEVYCSVPNVVIDGDYPDAWYQGVVSFSDDIWKINAETGIAEIVGSLSRMTDESIDGINLSINETDDYLLFTNKQDLSLWMLKITK